MQNLFNKFFTLVTILVLISNGVQSVSAQETIEFPSCLNPSGDIIASYDEGTHGIAGDSQEYTGEDTVYRVSEDTLVQCFCSDSGDGVQTNWWKVSSLTEDEIQILRNQGWIFIPNGSLWGLEETSYFAQNSSYACDNGNDSDNGENDEDTDEDDSGSTAGTSDSTGGVLGATTGSVLGLASTGNLRSILATGILGIAFLTVGIIAKRTNS